MINDNENVINQKWKRKIDYIKYDINRPRPRHGHEYTEYKMCLDLMMVMY